MDDPMKPHVFFDSREEQLDFLLHEYGHHCCNDHLSKDFYRALTTLGARMTVLALKKPECFQ